MSLLGLEEKNHLIMNGPRISLSVFVTTSMGQANTTLVRVRRIIKLKNGDQDILNQPQNFHLYQGWI